MPAERPSRINQIVVCGLVAVAVILALELALLSWNGRSASDAKELLMLITGGLIGFLKQPHPEMDSTVRTQSVETVNVNQPPAENA